MLFVSKNEILLYDFINKIYKRKNFDFNSKIIATQIVDNKAIIACFDRKIYELDLAKFEIKILNKAPSLITNLALHNGDFIATLINGNALYMGKIYQISDYKISSVSKFQNLIYFGDSKGNLIITDENLTITKNQNLANDEIKDIFINSANNGVIALFNGEVYECEI